MSEVQEPNEAPPRDNSGASRIFWVRKTLFTLLVLFILLLFVEIGLRFAGVTFYPRAITLSPEKNRELADVVLEPDGEVQWVVKPSTLADTPLAVNGLGLRGPEINTAKPHSTVRILCLGDSCTFGARVEKPYPAILQELCDQRLDTPVEVLNGGVPGHAAHQGVVMLNRRLAPDPDIVTVYYGWNDHWRRTEALQGPTIQPPPVTDNILVLRGLRLACSRWLARRDIAKEEADLDMARTELRLPPSHYYAMLDEFATISSNNGIEVIFFTAPYAFNQENLHWMVEERGWAASTTEIPELHKRYIELTRELAKDKNALLLDLAAIFRQYADTSPASLSMPLFHADGIHPTQEGHRLIANALFDLIKDRIKK